MANLQREHLRRVVARRIGSLAVVAAMLGTAGGCLDGLKRARASGNEASAIGSLRTIVSAQMTYSAVDCMGRYQPSLTSLGATGHLPPDLAAADRVEKAGYRITMTSSADVAAEPDQLPPACKGSVTAFTATAVPLQPGETGIRYFVTDEKGEVKQATSAAFGDATTLQ